MYEVPTSAEWMTLLKFTSPLIALFVSAAVALLFSAFLEDEESSFPGYLSLAGLAASFALAWQLWPQAEGARIAMLAIDRMALLSWMIIAVAGIFASAVSIPYLSLPACRSPEGGVSPVSRGDYFSLLLFSSFGMGVLVAAGDLVAVLVGLETMSLAAYALAGSLRGRAASLEGALKYFLMGAFATAFFAMGIAFIIGSAGTTDLAMLSERAADVVEGEGRSFFLFGCAMALIGFAFKIAAVPFHSWAPDAYDGAPTPIAALMATGIKAAAVVALARFAFSAPVHAGALWGGLIFALAIATMFVGNLAAIRQDNLKRMLAYSSIAHAGYLLVAFPSMLSYPTSSLRAILLYLVAYVVMTAGAFAAVAAIEERCGSADIQGIQGMGRRRPWLAAAFTLFLLSLAGFPPTLGFFGKYYLFLSAVRGGDIALVVAAVLASVISVYYYLRPVVVMYFYGEKTREEKTAPLSPAIVAVLAVAAAAVIAFGILPGNLVALIEGTVF